MHPASPRGPTLMARWSAILARGLLISVSVLISTRGSPHFCICQMVSYIGQRVSCIKRGGNMCRPDDSLCCLERLLFRPRPKELLRRPEGLLYRPDDLMNRILRRRVSQRFSTEGLLCRPEGLSCQSKRWPEPSGPSDKQPSVLARGLPVLTI